MVLSAASRPALILAAAVLVAAVAGPGHAQSRRHSRRGKAAVARAKPAPARRAAPAPRTPVPKRPATVEKACLEIGDLKSPQHAAAVTGALQRVPGVRFAMIDLRTGLGVVDYDPRQAALEQLLAACRDTGFPAVEYRVEERFPKPIRLKGG